MSGSFFSEKKILNLYTMMIFSFTLGGCVDEIVNNQTSYEDTSKCISFSILHWNSYISWVVKEFFRLSEKLFLIYAFV